ncbi:MAG: DNA oxidative demethylase AlkB [Thalassovita sp.]
MQSDLFGGQDDGHHLPQGAKVLRGFALPFYADIAVALDAVTRQAPFRNMTTPGGHRMSVAMTNCGALGWVSGPSGYSYSARDPDTGLAWPEMPQVFWALALSAASDAGYPFFTPDACLINQYLPGTKLSLHQDKDEADFDHPIVSVSLGLSGVFQFGGKARRDPLQLIEMVHGDVLVWGGPSRLFYHGVKPIKEGHHPALGAQRINLTFRKAN